MLRERVGSVGNDLGDLGPASRLGVESVRNEFRRMRQDTKETQNDIEALRKELENLDRIAKTPMNERVSGTISRRLADAQVVRNAREGNDSFTGQLRRDFMGGGGDGGGGGASFGNRVTSAGRMLFNLPSIQIGGGLSTDQIGRLLRGAGAGLDALGAGASQLAIAGPIAAAGVVAMAIGVDRFNKEIEASKRLLDGAVSAQENYYNAVGTLTSEQVREQIATLERIRPALEAQRAEAKNALDSAFQQAQAQFGDPVARSMFAAGAFSALEEALKKTEAELQTNTQTTTRYQQGLEQNVFAGNDAIEMERQLAEARAKTVQASADEARQNVLQEREFSRMSSTQARDRIDQYRAENRGLEAAMESISTSYGATTAQIREQADRFVAEGQSSSDAIRSALAAASVPPDLINQYMVYRDQLRQNRDDIDRVNRALEVNISLREREEMAIEQQLRVIDQRIAMETQAAELLSRGTVEGIDQRAQAIRAEQEAIARQLPELIALSAASDEGAQRLSAAQQRMVDLNAELNTLASVRPDVAVRQLREETEKLDEQLNQTISRLTVARDNRLTELADQLDQGLANLDDTFFEQQRRDQIRAEDQLEKFHQAEVRRVKDHRDNLLRIQRDGQIRIEDAAADGNIRAALEAERDLRNQVQDEQDKFDTQSDQRKEDLDNLKDSLDEQEQERLRDYQKRYNQLIDQNRREVNATLAKYQQDVNLQIQAYNIELSNLSTALNSEISLKNQANNAVLIATAEWANRMIGIANNLVRQANNQSSVITPQYVYVQDPFAAGFLQRAAGGDTPARRLVNVNEEGMESGINRRGQFMIFDDQTYVLNASKTRQLLEGDTSVLPGGRRGQGGGDTYIDFRGMSIPINGSNLDADAIAAKVEQKFLTNIIPRLQQQRYAGVRL
jgi:hypothetical protein